MISCRVLRTSPGLLPKSVTQPSYVGLGKVKFTWFDFHKIRRIRQAHAEKVISNSGGGSNNDKDMPLICKYF